MLLLFPLTVSMTVFLILPLSPSLAVSLTRSLTVSLTRSLTVSLAFTGRFTEVDLTLHMRLCNQYAAAAVSDVPHPLDAIQTTE